MAGLSCKGSLSEHAASEDQHVQGEHTQRNTQYLYNEPDNCLDTELGKGNGTQRPDSERSDAERGHVQDSHKDVQSSKSERTVGDYEKADTHSVLACLDDDGDFSGFSDSSSTSLKIQRKSRSKARPKARPLIPTDYKEAKAAVKQRRRARKNRKRYQKKKLYGPKKDAIDS